MAASSPLPSVLPSVLRHCGARVLDAQLDVRIASSPAVAGWCGSSGADGGPAFEQGGLVVAAAVGDAAATAHVAAVVEADGSLRLLSTNDRMLAGLSELVRALASSQ